MKIKNLCGALLLSLSSALATVNFPYPIDQDYDYGASRVTGKSSTLQALFETYLSTFYEESGSYARIKFDTDTYTVSEGIGYGMIMMVYFSDETTSYQSNFDKLWKYYNNWLDSYGLMNWKITGFSSVYGEGAATDAELDVAFALIMAAYQFGDDSYLDDAADLIAKIRQYEFDNSTYLHKPGDEWDDYKNPSYVSPAAFELFKSVDNESFWTSALSANYSLLLANRNSTTGLPSGWSDEDGDPVSGNTGYIAYDYDASRAPWRWAWSYAWFGHAKAATLLKTLSAWVASTSSTSELLMPMYVTDGSAYGSASVNATGIGPLTCTLMYSSSYASKMSTYTASLLSQAISSSSYFNASLEILTGLFLTGNMHNLKVLSEESEGSSSSSSGSSSSSEDSGFAWYGAKHQHRVETGFDDGSVTSGYWRSFNDEDNGGNSVVSWPTETGDGIDSLSTVIDECDGLCFTAKLVSGYKYPYIGVFFEVVNSDQEGANAKAWGGLDVCYTGEGKLIVEIAPEDEETVTEYNNFTYTLSAASSETKKSVSWSQFSQDTSWGVQTSVASIYTNLAVVKFKVQGLTVGTEYDYNITALGSYGALEDCMGPSDSASFAWYGTSGSSRIETGFDDGTETSGYWYSYNDEIDGGNSTVAWWVDHSGSDIDSLDEVVDGCGGLCFTITLGSGYTYRNAGVAFNVVNSDQEYANAGGWGGLDVCYTGDDELQIRLETEDEESVTEYNSYKVTLPATSSETLVSIPWSEFEQETNWGTLVSMSSIYKRLATVKFQVSELTVGTEYNYNITALGSYGALEDCVEPESSSSEAETSSSSSGSGSSSSTEGSSDSSPVAAAKVYAASKIMGTSLGLKVYTNSAAKVSVYDLRGSLVKSQKVGAGETEIGGLKAGAYMVKLSDGTKGMVRVQQ